jgi:XisH protein
VPILQGGENESTIREALRILRAQPVIMGKDRFHDVVRTALEKKGWQVTADPYEINVDDVDFEIDLAAEQLLAATRENQKIAVEIKSFISPSNVSDFHTALGQFLNYRDALEIIEPDRQLYLAVRVPIYKSFFQRRFIMAAIQRYQLRLITYDVQQEVIVQWL